MNREAYRAQLVRLYALAEVLETIPLDEMYDAIEHADALGAILDPTLYRDKADALDQDRDVVTAFIGVRNFIRGSKGRAEARKAKKA